MKIIINNKNGNSVKTEISGELIGKSIGDKIDGSLIGLEGYELQITGGNDKQGFSMRKDVEGMKRKRILLSKGPGFKPKRKGERRRKSIRGRIIAEDISVVSMKVLKQGKIPVEEIFKKPEEKKQE